MTRHPAVTAGAIATLDELAPERIFLGLGTGDSAVRNIGEKPSTLEGLQDYLACVNGILADGEADYQGKTVRGRAWPRRIPIAITAHGPKSLALGGAVAEMVVAGLGMTPEAVEYTEEQIARGVTRSDAGPEIWYLCYPGLGEQRGAILEGLGSVLAAGGNLLARSPARVTVPDRYRSGLQELAANYDYSAHVHADAAGANGQLIQRLGLTEYLAERFALVGTGEEVVKQVGAKAEIGVKRYWGVYGRDDVIEHIDGWGAGVIDRIDGHAMPGLGRA